MTGKTKGSTPNNAIISASGICSLKPLSLNYQSIVMQRTDAENLGKPFKKADSSRSNRSGSGLGLSIVKNIAMLHKFGFETKAENNIFTAKITF